MPYSRHRQRGQSLVETAIALVVLVPLAAGVMLLGQYIHIEQGAQSAAREAAWAATVDPSLIKAGLPGRQRIQTELQARQYADPGAAIRTRAGVPGRFSDTMLTTFAGQSLLKSSQLTLTTYKQGQGSSFLDKALGAVHKAAKIVGNFPPNSQGLVTAQVDVHPEKLAGSDGSPLSFMDPLDTRQLDFTARTVVLADTWQAGGSGEDRNGDQVSGGSGRTVRDVVRPLAPMDWLGGGMDKTIHDVSKLLGEIPLVNQVLTPGWKYYYPGRMAPDAVPADKLVPYKHAAR